MKTIKQNVKKIKFQYYKTVNLNYKNKTYKLQNVNTIKLVDVNYKPIECIQHPEIKNKK